MPAAPAEVLRPESRTRQALVRAGQSTRKVVRIATMPYWWPVGHLSRDVLRAPGRIRESFLQPVTMWKSMAQAEQRNWDRWSWAERKSVLRQATVWILGLLGALTLLAVVPAPLNLLPMLAVAGAWYLKRFWDPVRYLLGLPQLVYDEQGVPLRAEGGVGENGETAPQNEAQEVFLEPHEAPQAHDAPALHEPVGADAFRAVPGEAAFVGGSRLRGLPQEGGGTER